jgi:glutathione S-transferase
LSVQSLRFKRAPCGVRRNSHNGVPHGARRKIQSQIQEEASAPGQRQAEKPRAKADRVFFWPTPNGRKITAMLEEAGLPYVIRPVNIGKGDQFKPAFLKIAPNNRMPAIIDPNGPGGKPISVFESGAILQYLGRKTGKFYPKDERKRVEVDEWLHWQMGGLGPMAGQANHFRRYAPEKIEYGINRYTNEVRRLLGLLNKRLESESSSPGNCRSPISRFFRGPARSNGWGRTRRNSRISCAGSRHDGSASRDQARPCRYL